MWNLIFGLIAVVGGLSGKLVLRGTNSSGLLAVIGGVLIIIGLYQLLSNRNK